MLITKGCPARRVYRLKGGQRGYGGHVVNLAQNFGDFVKRLPRAAKDLPIVIVRRLGGEDTRKDTLVRRQRVLDAIVWLQANISFCSDISIGADALAALPDNETLTDLPLASEDCDRLRRRGVLRGMTTARIHVVNYP